MVVDLLREQGAEVEVFGDNFGQANARAVEVAKQPGNSYIHPYYHEETWYDSDNDFFYFSSIINIFHREGHSTMVDEMKSQLGDTTPGCFIVSVGGGGLLQGLLAGMKRNGWEKVPVIAVETKGADCLSKAIDAGKPVELRQITRFETNFIIIKYNKDIKIIVIAAGLKWKNSYTPATSPDLKIIS